ncbi:MAG: hypothetical protein ACYS4W_13165, partial [Planctomycetota bacterium]
MTTGTAARTKRNTLCKLHCRRIPASVDLPALTHVFANLKGTSILGGNPAAKDAGRFSYWAACPKEVFEFRTGHKDPFRKLHTALDRYKLEQDYSCSQLPKGIFRGGWIGYFSYELGRYIERLPETTIDDLKMPLI